MKKIGVIAALPIEARCLSAVGISIGESVQIEPGIYIRVAGMGRDNAARAAKQFIDENVQLLVSWGVAGALGEQAKSGELLIPETILNATGQVLEVNHSLIERLQKYAELKSIKTVTGKLTEAKDIIDTIEEKQALNLETGAIAVDMESAAILEQTLHNHVDFLCIRVISDDVTTLIPAVVTQNTTGTGELKLAGLILSLCRTPADLGSLIKLAKGFNQAKGTLKQCAGFIDELSVQ